MGIEIRPYTPAFTSAVALFNERLAQSGVSREMRFPTDHSVATSRCIFEERFVVVEDEFVRGGYIIKYQPFFVRGKIQYLGLLRLPLSEGIVNKSHVTVGVHILRDAMKAPCAQFALGMGGFDRPFPQMLRAIGWSLCSVPFYYTLNHPAQVLRNIQPLRRSALRRAVLEVAASTGLGWAAFKGVQSVRSRKGSNVRADVISRFEGWSDEVWKQCCHNYGLIAVRNSETLNELYPHNGRLVRLKISQEKVLGWSVVVDTLMNNDKYFGNLHVGTIVDCLSVPGHESLVIQASSSFLRERNVDLILSNQSHLAWCRGLEQAGFLRGPSNFVFAACPKLAQSIGESEEARRSLHLTRGDGDGPIHL